MNQEKKTYTFAQLAKMGPSKALRLCRRCNKPLTDYISKERGIGPECEEKEKAGE